MNELSSYRVGLVVPKCGLSDNQLADLSSRLRYIRNYLGNDGRLTVVAPALNLTKPEAPPEQVVKVLAYRARFDLEIPRPYRPEVDASIGAFLLGVLKECDEVWCCTGPRQGATSIARVADLYRRAQALPMKAAVRFKLVPAWVMHAVAQGEAKKMKPKERKWKDVF